MEYDRKLNKYLGQCVSKCQYGHYADD